MQRKWARVEYYGMGRGTQLKTDKGILARSDSGGSLRFYAEHYCRRHGLKGYTDMTKYRSAVVQVPGVFVEVGE